MIIFDLDGTLADCEHRRHFVDGRYHPDYKLHASPYYDYLHHETKEKFKPDWPAFYEACDKDEYIHETFNVFRSLRSTSDIEIWSGRCESIREKTKSWLSKYEPYLGWTDKITLKMRPIGDYTPDEKLKERWLDEALTVGKKIDFVFDDRPKVIRMWRRRGIFVFNCCQHENEF